MFPLEQQNNRENNNNNQENDNKLFALSLGVIVLLSVLGIIFPFLSFAAALIWPVPIVYLALKQGMRRAALLIVIAAIINGIFITPTLAMITVAGFGFVGFVMAGSLLEDFSAFKVLLFTILAAITSNFILMAGVSLGMGYSFPAGIRDALIDNVLTLLNNGELSVLVEMQIELIINMLPGLIAISGILTGILNYYIVHWFLRAKKMQVTIFPSVEKWRFPAKIISIAIVISILFRDQIVMLNIAAVAFFLVFIQGFGVGLYYIAKKTQSYFWKWIYVFLLIVIPVLPPVILILGLVDLWFDIRKIEFN